MNVRINLKENREALKLLQNQRNEMNQLNVEIERNKEKQTKLDKEKMKIKQEFVETFKQFEKDSVKLKVYIKGFNEGNVRKKESLALCVVAFYWIFGKIVLLRFNRQTH